MPRCKDSHTTYFKGISTADDTWTEEELQAVNQGNKQEAKEQYARLQAEKYERMAKYSLDRENKRKYAARAEEWKKETKSIRDSIEYQKKVGDDAKNIANSVQSSIIKLGNREVREKYIEAVANIKNNIDSSLPMEERARQAFEARNNIRTQARNMMADEETRKHLDSVRPNKTFEELIQSKMERKGMTREEAIQDIYETATKTNETVNKELGLGG